jgi:hypothetical protein
MQMLGVRRTRLWDGCNKLCLCIQSRDLTTNLSKDVVNHFFQAIVTRARLGNRKLACPPGTDVPEAEPLSPLMQLSAFFSLVV